MRHQGYFTRAMKARDPRFARIFSKLGYRTADLVATDDAIAIDDLRDRYKQIFGKRAFNGWNAKTLNEKIAAKQAKG